MRERETRSAGTQGLRSSAVGEKGKKEGEQWSQREAWRWALASESGTEWKGEGSESHRSECESQLGPALARGVLFPFLCLGFLICKTSIIAVPMFQG